MMINRFGIEMLDYTRELSGLPRKRGCIQLPSRKTTQSITFHYSGVVYIDRSQDVELRRILAEARYQLAHNYAKPGLPPAYPDTLLYEYIVLSSGLVVWTGQTREFWHCNNRTGNATSCPVHVMLGRGQPLTPAQRASLFALFDALRAGYSLPRSAVVAHCEWPVTDGAAVAGPAWRVQTGQSECPHRRLFADLAAYRAIDDGGRRWQSDVLTWRRAEARIAPDNRMADIPARTPVTGRLVAGERVTRPPYGTSDQWIALDDGGFAWSGPFREVR